jgi:iron complex transport system permease protein
MLIASRKLSPTTLITMLVVLLPAALLVALLTGPIFISPFDLFEIYFRPTESGNIQEQMILSSIRLPRLLLGCFIGISLSICGAAMQGLFRNPLADPSLIGVTSGASAGASCVIVLGGVWLEQAAFGLPLVAFGASVGGLIAVVIVYRIATSATGTSVATMLLAGIAISAVAGALNNLFSYFADNDMLRRISLWQMGSLDGANWQRVTIAAIVALTLRVVLPRLSVALNALLLGESEARHLGIDVERLKRMLIILTAIGVGSSVALAGVIAFIGLVVPHIVRLLIGPDHRYVIPASALAGAILLVLADSLARIIVAPAELPTGILTALLGAPVFFSLLAQQRSLRSGAV